MLVTSRNKGKSKPNPPPSETLKPVKGSAQNRWQRRDLRNPRVEETRVHNPNGASSSSQFPTIPVSSPKPTPAIPSPEIPCPVTILQPLTSPTLPLITLTPAPTSETVVLSSDTIPPVIASPLNLCSETLFSPNGSLSLSDIQKQSLQSTLCNPQKISSSSSPPCSISPTSSIVSSTIPSSLNHDPTHQPPLALSQSPQALEKSPQRASIPFPRTSDSFQNFSPGKSLPPGLVPPPQPVCDTAVGALPPVHSTSPRSCMGVLGGSPGRSLGKHLPLLPNPCSPISPLPGSGNLPFEPLHRLRRSSSTIHPTEPDFHPCHSTVTEQHSLSEPKPFFL
ncbi:hypothetical protein RHGRI_035436 [Rhododendron griersonianum]|uniref:Uncharacterized protein n=1 Tax=Rhododendron griersonianum TaxID=479676 RepID=A0AAV6I5D7_9ERIC|nr:hypothetical protein RHGRI_035436 [Rhododendron griersonianum]